MWKEKVFQSIRDCDMFGAELKLNILKSSTYKSRFGGFLTILLFLLIGALVITSFLELLYNNRYEFVIMHEHQLNPSSSPMNKDNFMFAIRIEDPLQTRLNRQDGKFFKLTLEEIEDQFHKDQRNRTLLASYQFVPCTAAHFEGIDFSDQPMLEAILSTYQCLPLNFSFQIEGTFMSRRFRYVKMSILLCTGSTDCYTSQEMESLKYNDNLRLQTLIMSSLINPSVKDEIIRNFVSTDFYTQTSPYQELSADLFFESAKLQIDDSIIPQARGQDPKNFWTFNMDSVRQTTSQVERPGRFFSIYIRQSQRSTMNKVTYQKIDNLVSYIGGIMKVLTAIFGLFALSYNSVGLNVALANELYNFNMPEKGHDGSIQFSLHSLNQFVKEQINKAKEMIHRFKNATLRVIRAHKALSLTSTGKVMFDQPTPRPFKKTLEDEEHITQLSNLQKDFLSSVLSQMLRAKKRIRLGLNFLISNLFCFQCVQRVQYERKLLAQCNQMISKDLDIVNIMQKLQQISKLKSILLDKDQIRMFNHCPTPVVNVDQEFKFQFEKHKHRSLLGKPHSFDTQKSLSKLYASYSRIEEKKTELNQRLLQMMDENLREVFDYQLQLTKLYERHLKKGDIKPIEQQDRNDLMRKGKILADDGEIPFSDG